MAEPKTRPTNESVDDFIERIGKEQIREDSRKVAAMMREATGAEPRMWGGGIIGFGTHRLRYANGSEADWPEIAFAPRKSQITLYILPELKDYDLYLVRLGKQQHGKSCLHIKRLSDVDESVLREIIRASVEETREGR